MDSPLPQVCLRRVGRLLGKFCRQWNGLNGSGSPSESSSKPADGFSERRVASPEPSPVPRHPELPVVDSGSSDDAKIWEAAKYLERADKEREAGSHAFRAGDTDQAIDRYQHGAVAALDMSARAADLITSKGGERSSFIGEVNAERIRVLTNLALCYKRKESIDQAKHCCNLALGIDLNNVRALTILGSIHHQHGDVQGAVDIVLKALNIDPWDKVARAEKARIILAESKKEGSAKDMAKAELGVLQENTPLDVI